jgi:hypothetical protein
LAENELKTIAALKGIGVSPGIVIGKAHVLNQQDIKEKHYKLDNERFVSREIRSGGSKRRSGNPNRNCSGSRATSIIIRESDRS